MSRRNKSRPNQKRSKENAAPVREAASVKEAPVKEVFPAEETAYAKEAPPEKEEFTAKETPSVKASVAKKPMLRVGKTPDFKPVVNKITALLKRLIKALLNFRLGSSHKEFIRLAGTLLAVTVVAGAILGWVHGITAEKISNANTQMIADALSQLIPQASFTEIRVPASADPAIRAAWAADISCAAAGMCVEVTPGGLSGGVTVLVGIGEDGKITGVQIAEHGEITGLGAGVAENGIYAGSAATETSAAVTQSVQAALSYARDYLGVE